MATVATTELKWLASEWKKLYKSAVVSGIVGDTRHAARGGYHISRQDQPKSNYSVVRADDKAGRADAAAAIDMNLSESDMRLCTGRLIAVFTNKSDPRRKYLNGFNGWNGSGSAKRYDIAGSRVSSASSDHKWHVHLEIRRRYTESMIAMRAVLSVLRGESVAAYYTSIGLSPTGAVKAPVAKAKVAAPPYPGHLLAKGAGKARPDPDVKKWQARMIARGWTSIGRADGVFGEKTENVVRAVQKLGKVTVDGVIGRRTWPLPWTL
jgi:hypothetical protein